MGAVVRFQALSLLTRGYALAGLAAVALALSGAGIWSAILVFWLGGAIMTLGLGVLEINDSSSEAPVRVSSKIEDLSPRHL